MLRGLSALAAGLLLIGASASAETPAERGRYLVETIAGCGNCHTPQGPNGPLPGRHLAGGLVMDEGVFQAVMAFQMRPHSGWGWMLTAGILSVIVGLIILIQWPLSTAYALGYLAGISLIFSGWSYVMISLAARRI